MAARCWCFTNCVRCEIGRLFEFVVEDGGGEFDCEGHCKVGKLVSEVGFVGSKLNDGGLSDAVRQCRLRLPEDQLRNRRRSLLHVQSGMPASDRELGCVCAELTRERRSGANSAIGRAVAASPLKTATVESHDESIGPPADRDFTFGVKPVHHSNNFCLRCLNVGKAGRAEHFDFFPKLPRHVRTCFPKWW